MKYLLIAILLLSHGVLLAQTKFNYDEKGNLISVAYSGTKPCNQQVSQVSTVPMLSVSPNPAINEIDIRFLLKEDDDVTIETYNMLGQKLKSVTYMKMKKEVYHLEVGYDVSKLASGLYLIVLRPHRGKLANVKLIKQ